MCSNTGYGPVADNMTACVDGYANGWNKVCDPSSDFFKHSGFSCPLTEDELYPKTS
jgi:hypothetical protein